ncbi:hypothetical protein [Micromonospora sp. NBC_00858]|uniref:hypothetical protein n=1 Tax=Micromonospora sp. NBC_00858 TaxID=2975979 RepID=UPI003869E690|nr:hypothetical protein OG990_05170 [Micromonospora sp. NBC_00858]
MQAPDHSGFRPCSPPAGIEPAAPALGQRPGRGQGDLFVLVGSLDAAPQLGTTTSAFTFEGDLERSATTTHRGEQALLRQRLFGSATDAACAICGEIYPARFLRAAHIKQRSVCREQEARDLDHIAMPACLFGCDALFEAGYIAVDSTGDVIATDHPGHPPGLVERLALLAGRKVDAHTTRSAAYFTWHRENIYHG